MVSPIAASVVYLLLTRYAAAIAAPSKSIHDNRPEISCSQFIVPITASADNYIVKDPVRVDSNIDAVNYAWDYDTWSHGRYNQSRIASVNSVKGTYNISVQLCVPSEARGTGETLQIVTHGLLFDKRYWDSEYEPENYSYVRAAVGAGYSVLTWDRLGTGQSDKPDAYDVVQAPLELEILREITILARSGQLSRMAHPSFSAPLPAIRKYIHIGHSFGTILTLAFLAKYPTLSDGAIATGQILSPHGGAATQASFGWQYAHQHDPKLYADYGSGYIVPGTESDIQQGFFSVVDGLMDPKALSYANSIKNPATVGEFHSILLSVGLPAPNYTAPLQFFLAEYDYLTCGGDCKNAYNLTQLKQSLYPQAAALQAYIQPGTGHGLTLHKNATAGYQVMFDFLKRHQL